MTTFPAVPVIVKTASLPEQIGVGEVKVGVVKDLLKKYGVTDETQTYRDMIIYNIDKKKREDEALEIKIKNRYERLGEHYEKHKEVTDEAQAKLHNGVGELQEINPILFEPILIKSGVYKGAYLHL